MLDERAAVELHNEHAGGRLVALCGSLEELAELVLCNASRLFSADRPQEGLE